MDHPVSRVFGIRRMELSFSNFPMRNGLLSKSVPKYMAHPVKRV